MATAVAEPGSQERRSSLTNAIIVVAAAMLATTLAQPQALGRIPLQNLLKNSLHVSRTMNAAFFFWIGLPWYFKPIVGIFTDAVPVFGSRRKTYIIVNSVLAGISWLGLYFTPIQYNKLLIVTVILDFFMVVVSTVAGGYMVEVAQEHAGSGRLTAVRQVTYYLTNMISGPAGGFLASVAIGFTIAACGGIMFLLVPVILIFLHEQRRKVDSQEVIRNAKLQFVNISTAGTMWIASGLMALFYIAPGFQTAIFYRQQDVMHLNTEAQGYLAFAGGLLGVIASFWYGWVCKRINLRNLLLICLIAATIANLGYMFYSTYMKAFFIDGLNGFAYSIAESALLDLAIRATPKGSEGMGYSLMLSVRNFALFGTDILGSWLLDKYHFQFNSLVISNSVTTALAVPIILFLPLYMVGRKDGEAAGEPPAPKELVQE